MDNFTYRERSTIYNLILLTKEILPHFQISFTTLTLGILTTLRLAILSRIKKIKK